MKISPSVKQWAVSFLLVDVAFWLFLLVSSLLNQIDGEAIGFGVGFFYMPWNYFLGLLPSWMTSWGDSSFDLQIVFMTLYGTAVHALLGGEIGWLLRNRKIYWVVSVFAAFVVILGFSFVFVWKQSNDELKRETYSDLWLIDQPSASMVSYNQATITGDGTPSSFGVQLDNGHTNQTLRDTNRTKAYLICNSDVCSKQSVDGKVQMTWAQYVAVHDECKADPVSCPYYNIGTYDLFDVVFDPFGILTMNQHYTP